MTVHFAQEERKASGEKSEAFLKMHRAVDKRKAAAYNQPNKRKEKLSNAF
jgi:hypothetical protein